MFEIWRDIKDYEGFYQVSNLGRVRSLDRWVTFINNGTECSRFHKGVILKQCFMKDYLVVSLPVEGKMKSFKVHQLVANAFPEICGTWFPGAQIDHRDGNRLNNTAKNLWYCTPSQNQNNPISKERKSNSLKGKLTNRTDQSKPVHQFTKDGIFVAEYQSIRDAERATGVCHSGISSCCRGKGYKSAGGFIWKYCQTG